MTATRLHSQRIAAKAAANRANKALFYALPPETLRAEIQLEPVLHDSIYPPADDDGDEKPERRKPGSISQQRIYDLLSWQDLNIRQITKIINEPKYIVTQAIRSLKDKRLVIGVSPPRIAGGEKYRAVLD